MSVVRHHVSGLLKILGYLSNFDVLRNVAVVSKKFHELSQDQHLIRKIEVDSAAWPDDLNEEYCKRFLEVIKRSLNLTFLSFGDNFNNGGAIKGMEIKNENNQKFNICLHEYPGFAGTEEVGQAHEITQIASDDFVSNSDLGSIFHVDRVGDQAPSGNSLCHSGIQ